ncbi:ribosome small subunit-dependent GTPase A [Bacillus mangrovi]|uniref:Small ribosomal subunit biogenesis GTPase RsgA n=1 Tax=Metabacillus mangrovi TaxID=1491830 RepID=A0A7X2V436_9BACI|nr:ribosome small subunit-dependent GTPase A [Metabacillus mangrovi]MTH52696.1 ribosome small subunit-dependent GTPase A [Metabacillus mangrovi]
MPEGKIIKALAGFYYVLDGERLVQCRGRGLFRKNKITPLVGDEVVYQAENDLEGTINEVRPRKNELVRPPIANVDQAILVFSSIEPAFSTLLLDRFLVLVEANDIDPLIIISKADLIENEALKDQILSYAADYRENGYPVYQTSTESMDGISSVAPLFQGKISVIAGQSGVGKSSLLNAVKPDLALKTDDISTHLGRGKHTTRHVELVAIDNGLVADTPGFSSLDFTGIEVQDLGMCFPEMRERARDCKFRGCTHVAEPKCAVKAAVEDGAIRDYRYEHYLSFLEEIKERKPRY